MYQADAFSGDGFEMLAARTASAAIVGGTAALIGGGKFANGAVTAAFVHLFNAESALWRHALRGFASMASELAGANYTEIGSEFYFRSDNGVIVRLDGAFLHNGSGQLLIGEAKVGDWSNLTPNKRLAFGELQRGEGIFYGPRAAGIATALGITSQSDGSFRVPSERIQGIGVFIEEKGRSLTSRMREFNDFLRGRGGYTRSEPMN